MSVIYCFECQQYVDTDYYDFEIIDGKDVCENCLPDDEEEV